MHFMQIKSYTLHPRDCHVRFGNCPVSKAAIPFVQKHGQKRKLKCT